MVEESIRPIWTHWHGHVEVVLGLALLEGAYLFGVGPLRERWNLADEVDPKKIATFTAGVLVIFFSLLSPLHILGDHYLFSAHMTQHVLLTLVAPPLLILGTPDWLIRPLLRPNLSFYVWRFVTRPVVAVLVFNLVFALWHVPDLYNLSVTVHAVHVTEHLLFIGAAMLMWWPLTSSMPELPRLPYSLQMVYLFVLSITQIFVFVFVTFSKQPLYEWYVKAPQIWVISPLVDQQIGGIIMKVGGSILFLTLIVVAFFKWYNDEERRTKDEKRRVSPHFPVDEDNLLSTA
jgi:putative membrane protein